MKFRLPMQRFKYSKNGREKSGLIGFELTMGYM